MVTFILLAVLALFVLAAAVTVHDGMRGHLDGHVRTVGLRYRRRSL